jgi:hypothetical protein
VAIRGDDSEMKEGLRIRKSAPTARVFTRPHMVRRMNGCRKE